MNPYWGGLQKCGWGVTYRNRNHFGAASQKPTSAWAHKIWKLESHCITCGQLKRLQSVLSRLLGLSEPLAGSSAFLRVTLGSLYCLFTQAKEDLVNLVNCWDSLELFWVVHFPDRNVSSAQGDSVFSTLPKVLWTSSLRWEHYYSLSFQTGHSSCLKNKWQFYCQQGRQDKGSWRWKRGWPM